MHVSSAQLRGIAAPCDTPSAIRTSFPRASALPLLSILVPVHDEESTLGEVLARLLAFDATPYGFSTEIIVCDDGSTDRSASIATAVAMRDARVRVVRHANNRGKGAAVRTALAAARGDYGLVQDADLEYEVSDYPRLLAPAKRGAPAVFGSRFLTRRRPRAMRASHWLANRLLTCQANWLFGLRLTDEATCYKLVRIDLLRAMHLTCDRFEFCPEVVAKLALAGVPIVEVPVSYRARTVAEGKKIRWTDGVRALFTLYEHRVRAWLARHPTWLRRAILLVVLLACATRVAEA